MYNLVGGTGYSVQNNVNLTGGNGSNATANITAVDGNGAITSFDIVNAGSNYGNNNTLTFDAGNNDATIKVGTVQSTIPQIYNVSWDTTQASSIDEPLNLMNQASFYSRNIGTNNTNVQCSTHRCYAVGSGIQ